MRLLFLNAFKGLKKKKVQMFGIIVMVLLSTAIYTAMNTALDRVEDRYYNYLDEQNVEILSMDPVIDYKKDVTAEQYQTLKETFFTKVNASEQPILDTYEMCLQTEFSACNDTLYKGVSYLFQKYGASEEIGKQKFDSIKDKYQFQYELEKAKVLKDNQYIYKAFPYQKGQKINKPYLVDGRFPTKDNEITLLPNFAKSNDLEIGDTYKIDGISYKIVGTAYASSHIYPLISMSTPFFDERYNAIMYMTPTAYEAYTGVQEINYVMAMNGEANRRDRISMGPETTRSKNKTMDTLEAMLEENPDKVSYGMMNTMRAMRTDMIQMEFASNRTFAEMFLYLLLGVSVFIIVVITKKRIDDERLQIGVLKSLGYRPYRIAVGYLVYPIVGSIVGGILGYLIGISANGFLAQMFLNYYNVPLVGFSLDPKYFATCIFIPMVVLSVLSYLIAIFMLRKKPLDLLKEGSNLHVNWLSKITNKVTGRLSFESKFRYSLASRSFGKLLIVSLTSFCTGLLIVLILIGMNLFQSMIDKSFEGMKYQYVVNYNMPQYDTDTTDDLVLQASMNVTGVKDSTGASKKLEEKDYSLSLSGVDSYTKYVVVQDKDANNLLPKLYEENGIVINQNVKEVLKLEVGDMITLTYNSKKYDYKIVGVSQEYIGSSVYISRGELSNLLGLESTGYTTKYSKQNKYANMKSLDENELKQINSIFNFDDLKRNIGKQMQTANSAIYFVILFASFMALVIIAVIANIVVEENKKTISLMKVMGYKNKAISSIVLNIYTPFVIISYLLSIPVMITILKAIVNALVGDMNMAIPIAMSPTLALLGLVGLLVAYYIAISLSKRVLNKVPLAVALKRE